MISKFISIVICFASICSGVLGQNSATSAALIDPFNTTSDNLGKISNSVNIFNGDLNLPLNLVSIPVREGLSFDVSAFYTSSNVESASSTWNLDSPTGILGMGWELQSTLIVADNKQTLAHDDDTYYLQESGNSTELICTGISGSVRTFQTKAYSNKKITFTDYTDRWDVTLENGTKLVFGDLNSNLGNAIQWVVGVHNWIGDTNQTTLSSHQGYIWNLSQMINIYGDKITYTYNKVENSLGSGSGATQTEASYLSSITDSFGHEVDFVYQNKLAEEIMEPHTEQTEPDAYQEVYERMYLDKILVKADGNQAYEIDFRYSFYSAGVLSHGNNKKRLLSSMVKVATGLQSPIMRFDYNQSGPMAGAISVINLPSGGSITYTYSPGTLITNKSNVLPFSIPANFQGLRIVSDENYSIIYSTHVGSDPEPLDLMVASWDGEWKLTSLTSKLDYTSTRATSTNPPTNPPIDMKIATEENFFAIVLPDLTMPNIYHLNIARRSESTNGGWIVFSTQMNFTPGASSTKSSLITGENFVAVSDNYGKIFRYAYSTMNGIDGWVAGPVINESTGTHYTTGANNYIISHNTTTSPNQVTFYYLDEQKNWAAPISIPTSWSTTGIAQWYCNNNQAFVIPTGGNAQFYYWAKDYSAFYQIDKGFNYSGTYSGITVYFSTSTIGLSGVQLVYPNGNFVGRGLRFNGSDWVDSYEQIPQGFSDDMMASAYTPFYGTLPPQSVYVFNANQNSWGSTLVASPYQNIQNGSIASNSNFYFLNPDGSWNVQALPITSSINWPWSWNAYGSYFTDQNNVYFTKNGSVSGTFSLANFETANNISMINANDAGPSTFTAYNRNNNGPGQPGYLIRTDPKTYNNSTNSGTFFTDYPIIEIGIFDGTRFYYTSFKYETSTATVDPSISTAQYNKVTTIPGSLAATSTPYGYTENYFFNGVSDTELGATFPVSMQTQTPGYNASNNYKQLTGQVYRTISYDNNGVLVSKVENTFNVITANVLNSYGVSVGVCYQISLIEKNSIQDGIQTYTDWNFNALRQVSRTQEITLSTNNSETVEMLYTYAWNVYPSLQAKNMLIQKYTLTKSLNAQYFEGTLTRYNESFACTTCGGSIPVVYDQYMWHSNGTPSTPPSSILTAPAGDWLVHRIVSARDPYNGIETEIKGRSGQLVSFIYDGLKRSEIATVNNASSALTAYTSFEDASFGNWSTFGNGSITSTPTPAKTGNSYFILGTNGVTKTGLNTGDQYVLTFWAKTSGSSSVNISGVGSGYSLGTCSDWTLKQFKISNLSSFSLSLSSGTVWIDEVSLVPVNSYLRTNTYHPLFGKTSITDENNSTTFYTYDVFGRLITESDQYHNILKNVIYNFAK